MDEKKKNIIVVILGITILIAGVFAIVSIKPIDDKTVYYEYSGVLSEIRFEPNPEASDYLQVIME